jgi:hypothetical protein
MNVTTFNSNETAVPRRRRGFTAWSQRTAALVAGVGLALMAVLAGFSNFGAIVPLIAAGDALQTAQNISTSPLLFWAGVAGFALTAVLDVVVAAALYVVFRPVNRRLSAVAGWMRAIYGVLLAACVSQLVVGFSLLSDPSAALPVLESFNTSWVISQGLFGVSLILVGYLGIRADFMAKIFGVLLALAGLSYLADAIGTAVIPGFTAMFAQFLFVGEVVLIFWLLIRGRRLPSN